MMAITFELRPATIYDKEFMKRLENETWGKYAESDPDIELDEDRQKEHYEKDFRPKYVSIIEYSGHPVGAYSVLVKRKKIFIVYLYLLPEYQKTRTMKNLIGAVLKRAKEERKPVMTCVYRGGSGGIH